MDFKKVTEIVEYVGHNSNGMIMPMKILVQSSVSLFVIFVTRMNMILRANRLRLFRTTSVNKKKKSVIINHIGLEYLIAFLISFILLMVAKSTPGNVILNALVAPFLGLIISLCIDNWYLIPKESNLMFSRAHDRKPQVANNLSEIGDVAELLDQEVIDSDDFRPIVAKSINQIKRVQQEHEVKIDNIEKKCDSSIDLLLKLQKANMNDKKIALKAEIYECLNKGYATPVEFDRITINYDSYHNQLNGNSEVQSLYEKHFLTLPVHENRRNENIEVNEERRKYKNIIYGQFDNEDV